MFGQIEGQSCSKQGKQITNGQKCNKDEIESIIYAIFVAFFSIALLTVRFILMLNDA